MEAELTTNGTQVTIKGDAEEVADAVARLTRDRETDIEIPEWYWKVLRGAYSAEPSGYTDIEVQDFDASDLRPVSIGELLTDDEFSAPLAFGGPGWDS